MGKFRLSSDSRAIDRTDGNHSLHFHTYPHSNPLYARARSGSHHNESTSSSRSRARGEIKFRFLSRDRSHSSSISRSNSSSPRNNNIKIHRRISRSRSRSSSNYSNHSIYCQGDSINSQYYANNHRNVGIQAEYSNRDYDTNGSNTIQYRIKNDECKSIYSINVNGEDQGNLWSTSRSRRMAMFDEKYSDLPLEFWDRSPECKEAKMDHMDRIDRIMGGNREDMVLMTTLRDDDIVLEENMFPYDTPQGVSHYTLWSTRDLSHDEIRYFVCDWLDRHMPHVRRWQYDDNLGERTILLFHVHVYIETMPFSFEPREDQVYYPPHIQQQL